MFVKLYVSERYFHIHVGHFESDVRKMQLRIHPLKIHSSRYVSMMVITQLLHELLPLMTGIYSATAIHALILIIKLGPEKLPTHVYHRATISYARE